MIAANSTVLYPILTSNTATATATPSVQVPEFFVVTSHMGNVIQAVVLRNEDVAFFGILPGDHTVRKEVFIKGPTAPTTRKALEVLLRYTEDIKATKWSDHMRIPFGQNAVPGPNGAAHYKP